MTDAQYQDWLDNPNSIRTVLVEVVANVAGTDTTRYLATQAFNTGASDTPANQTYIPVISGGVKFTEQLTTTNSGSISVGEVQVDNSSGAYDSWLQDIWVNRPIKAYIGDPRWIRSDFRLIFNGIVSDIDSKTRDKLNLSIRDKLQRLNTPVIDTKLGGTTPNKDSVLPLVFGEVHNITPLLTNPATLEYQVHNGIVENIFEVRDNGIPVSATVTNSTGKFILPASPVGTVTASAQGDKPAGVYYNTISQLIQRIVTGYGKVSDRFTSSDLDTANLAAFDTAHPQAVGEYLDARTNVLAVCQELAASVGAQIVMSRSGLLRLIAITLPAVGTPVNIYPYHIVERTLQISGRTPVVASVKVGFCRNYTVQAGLQTNIPAQHKDLYALDWLTTTSVDTTVESVYHLNEEPVQQNTQLLTYADSQAESDRRLALYKVTRTTYKFEATASMLTLELGQAVNLFNPRFGLATGKLGQVVSLAPDWMTGRVVVEVMI